METSTTSVLYTAFEYLGIGILLLNDKSEVLIVNRWLLSAAQRDPETLIGKPLVEAFPELQNGRLPLAINLALQRGLPSLLSQSLNKSPFNLYKNIDGKNERMQQAIQITPLTQFTGDKYCLIQVQDVTASVLREQMLEERAEAMRRYAYQDPLTGLLNRRSFDEKLQEEWSRCKRLNEPLGLLLLSVDHFKRLTDAHGHPYADQSLQDIARTVTALVHEQDALVARFSTEEIAVLLPLTKIQDCVHLAQQMVEAVRLLGRGHTSSPHGIVSISVGYACLVPSEELDAMHILQEASLSLYFAKQNNGNQVSLNQMNLAV